jgi:hypothetical protein
VELAELLTDALHDGLLTPEEAQLIARSRIGGQTIADLAVQRRQGTRTLWHRRRRAELRLAAAQAVPLAESGSRSGGHPMVTVGDDRESRQ